jgi:hypothetical protein
VIKNGKKIPLSEGRFWDNQKKTIANNMVGFRQMKQVFALVLFFLFISMPSAIHAEFFKYVDKDGKVHFVDDESKIPVEHLDTIRGYKERYDDLSEEQKKIMLQKDSDFEIKKTQDLKQDAYLKKQLEQLETEKNIQRMTVKVTIIGNQVLVPSKISYNGHEVDALLLLDTGASITALHYDLFGHLSLMYPSKVFKMFGAGGDAIESRFVTLNYVKVGPVKKTDVHAVIIERKGPPVIHDGLLGMNFLRDFEYTTDFENQTITWGQKH